MEGEVVAAGPGIRGDDGRLHPIDLKAGDRVLFGKWSGTECKIDDEELVVMKESDILGVIMSAIDDQLPGIPDVPLPDELPELPEETELSQE